MRVCAQWQDYRVGILGQEDQDLDLLVPYGTCLRARARRREGPGTFFDFATITVLPTPSPRAAGEGRSSCPRRLHISDSINTVAARTTRINNDAIVVLAATVLKYYSWGEEANPACPVQGHR